MAKKRKAAADYSNRRVLKLPEVMEYTRSITRLLEAPEVSDLMEMMERASWLAYD